MHPDDAAGSLAERIAARAYERYLARGGAHGHHREDWLAAEAEIQGAVHEVVLLEPGPKTIEVLRELRQRTGLPLRDLQVLVDAAPRTVTHLPLRDAEPLREALGALGARVELRPARR